jgi:hypothetical protein
MLGFHRRTRSLIPVKDLGKYDKIQMREEYYDEEEEDEEGVESYSAPDAKDTSRTRQLMLVYLVFLAEAYVLPKCYKQPFMCLEA